MTTILTVTRGAGTIPVVEVDDWDAAGEKLRNCETALFVCDDEALHAGDSASIHKALGALGAAKQSAALAPDIARSLSHDLRTPLSAMAGWLHLMESGKLDEAGMKRAIGKLRGNIDDQVRTIDRFLGTSNG